MFYDLNVPYSPTDPGLSRTLNFSHELGYNAVALNHSITGKLPNEISCGIPSPLPFKDLPPTLQLLTRCTLHLTETHQNARLLALASHYHILALRPTDEKSLQLACSSLDCDIISLDLSIRHPFHFKHKMLMEAIKAGKKIEICYSQGMMGDSQARRNLIGNVSQIVRATRGRGLVISSEAKSAVGLRGPWDAVNLAAVWGLGQERGFEGVTKEARSAVVSAQLKRTGWRGTINVVYGGERPAEMAEPVANVKAAAVTKQAATSKGTLNGKNDATPGTKRKARSEADTGNVHTGDKPLSKTQVKKRAKLEKLAAEAKQKEQTEAVTTG
ncbi:RNA-binding RNA processing protein rpp1 [Oleoguttula sp. CCFEE 5521]